MTRKAKYLELRRFSGTTLEHCLGYLRRDVSKAFDDLFAILGQKKQIPMFRSIAVSDGSSAATGTNFTMAELVLPKGVWHVTTIAGYDVASTGHSINRSRAWMSLAPDGTNIPDDAILGQNYTIFNPANAVNQTSHAVQLLLDLKSESTVTLEGRATFSGGAGVLSYGCSVVAHGYVTE